MNLCDVTAINNSSSGPARIATGVAMKKPLLYYFFLRLPVKKLATVHSFALLRY